MKKIIYLLIITFMFSSCCKSGDDEIINPNPHNIIDLGLNAQNNIYPFWPDTFQYLGSNQWYDYKKGDTLIVHRRDVVTDDSGDEIEYRFLVKKNEWIKQLNIIRISNDAYIDPPRFNQLMFDKPIINFRIQQYTQNQVLACEIETPNGDYFLSQTLIDKMYINLSD